MVFTLAFGGLGYGVGNLIGRLAKGKLELGADPVWLWATPLLMLGVILLHEGGHAVAGWLVGFRLHMLTAGPLRWDRQGGKMKLGFNRQLGLWGGICASVADPEVPPGLKHLRQRTLWMVLGGPLASVLGTLVGLGLAWWLGPGPQRLLLGLFGLTNGAIALATAIPQCMGGFVSDGKRVLDLMKEGPAADRFCAVATLGSLSQKVRPRDWPREVVEMATAWEDDSYDGITAAFLRYSFHLDRREIAEARVWLEKMLAKVEEWPGSFQPIVYSSAAYFYAMEEPDAEKAESYHAKSCKSAIIPAEGKVLNEAALAVLRGERETVKAALEKGRRLAASQTGSVGEAMRETLELIEARASR
ncbi:MAG: hypothetical protein NW208_12770 [Bryobacter sp.]|nr:hypothetical protein [Bryobacter sp.]